MALIALSKLIHDFPAFIGKNVFLKAEDLCQSWAEMANVYIMKARNIFHKLDICHQFSNVYWSIIDLKSIQRLFKIPLLFISVTRNCSNTCYRWWVPRLEIISFGCSETVATCLDSRAARYSQELPRGWWPQDRSCWPRRFWRGTY